MDLFVAWLLLSVVNGTFFLFILYLIVAAIICWKLSNNIENEKYKNILKGKMKNSSPLKLKVLSEHMKNTSNTHIIDIYDEEDDKNRRISSNTKRINFIHPTCIGILIFSSITTIPIFVMGSPIVMLISFPAACVITNLSIAILSEMRVSQRHKYGINDKAEDIKDHISAGYASKCAYDGAKHYGHCIGETYKPNNHEV